MRISTTQDKQKKVKLWAVLFWLAVWQVASMIIDKEILLVSPISTIRELLILVRTSYFWQSILMSVGRIGLGFLLALLLGGIVASGSVRYRRLGELLAPLIQTIKSIPVASFIILCLIWLDTSSLSTFIAFLMVFPVIYTNTFEGITNIDTGLYEMAVVYRIPMFKRIRYIYMAEIMPYLVSACKISLGLCWKAGIAAEIIGIPKNSIGEHLYLSKLYLNMRELFAWTLVIVLISILFEKFILKLLLILLRRLEH